MAKQVTIDQLVYAVAGPKPKEDEYRFRRRTFRRVAPKPGEHEKRYEQYTTR